METSVLPARFSNMPLLDSDALLAVHYEPESRTLRAVFRESRRVYEYAQVPQQVYDALLAAPSRGHYFNRNIRDLYRFHRVG